jgi:membrane carboxypeptidase/penicillin-binding protein
VAVRIGFDDNRSLGTQETGGRVALPVFREIVLGAYGKKLVGPAPRFPAEMEQRIDVYLKGGLVETTAGTNTAPAPPGKLSAMSFQPSAFGFERPAAPVWLRADR